MFPQETPPAGRAAPVAGFTLVELLVVVGLLAVLSLVLLPTLAATRTQDRSAVCMNNLRQIYAGMMVYATDYNDTFYHTGGGNTSNEGQWTVNPASSVLLSPNHSLAYWGLAYHVYASVPRELFRCPSAKIVDQGVSGDLSSFHETWLTSTYGLSQYVTKTYPAGALQKVTDVENPSTMIITHDAAEQRMEGSSDSLALFPGDTRLLAQWIGSSAPTNYGGISGLLYGGYHFEDEWYRHGRSSSTLLLSGQVLKIPFTGYSSGIDYRYYTGEKPLTPLPGN